MRVKAIIFSFIVLFVTGVSTLSIGQQRAIDKEAWYNATDGFEYNEAPKKKEKPKDAAVSETQSPSNFNLGDFLGSFTVVFQVLGFIALIALIVFILYKLLPYAESRNKKIKSFEDIGLDPDRLEENMKDLDFDALVNEAIKNKNYTLAIRLYYLRILKDLWDHQFIIWKKEKTNYDYILETGSQPFSNDFKKLTDNFEISWYGEKETDVLYYESYKTQAQNFLQQLNG